MESSKQRMVYLKDEQEIVVGKWMILTAAASAGGASLSAPMTGYGHTELFKVTCYNFQPSRAC